MLFDNGIRLLSSVPNTDGTGIDSGIIFAVIALIIGIVFVIVALIITIVSIVVCLILISQQRKKSEELLTQNERIREKQESLGRIIASTPMAFILCSGNVVYTSNEAAKKIMEIEEGNKLSDICDDKKSLENIFMKVKVNGIVSSEIMSLKFKDGKIHRCILNFELTKYDGEEMTAVWAIDIEQLEAKKDKLRAAYQDMLTMLDVLPISVRIVDVETKKIVYANNLCIEMFKYGSLGGACGHDLLDSFPSFQSDGTSREELINCVLSKTSSGNVNVEYVATDGSKIYANVIYCKINYNGKFSSLGVIQDLAAEREYQTRLLNAAEREKEANQLKSRFLVNMSHEIRTPMNAIIGLTEIEIKKERDKRVREVYRKINISAKSLLEIVNDVLDLSKLEASKVELCNCEFELSETLNSALLVASPKLEGKNLELMLNASLDLPRYIVGDRKKLWRILKNFIDNSARYTKEGRITLTVAVSADNNDGDDITIDFIIEDTGTGIDSEQMEKLFMPYEQIRDSAQKKYSGIGLGMAISKQLCEIMGGAIEIDSRVGIGTTIRMSIPFKRSSNRETVIQASTPSMLKGVEILAVDDDALSREIMHRLSTECGANCTLAKSGDEAIRIILDWRSRGKYFDVILLDYMMDGLNGIETARQINLALSNAPKLLMVTAYQKLLLKSELKRNAIEDIIEKPYIPTQFISKIYETVGKIEENSSESSSEDCFMQFTGANVLLCEDNELNQEVAAGMFEQFGIVPIIASNGKEGLEILSSGRQFDLVFMDLQMPVMDGYSTAKAIREDPCISEVPIIALTADAMTEVVEKCLEAGMNGHMTKPLEFENLTKIFGDWIPESKRALPGGNTSTEIPRDLPLPEILDSQEEIAGSTASSAAEPKSQVHHQSFVPPTKALARFGGKIELYSKAVKSFAQSLPDEWQDFESAMQNEEELAREVHKLKGTAGNLGEDEIYQCTVDFEESMRSHTPDRDLYYNLVEACHAAKARIIGQETAGSHQAGISDSILANLGTDREFRELTACLRTALENYDPAESSEILELLQGKNWLADAAHLKKLYKCVDGYEFDEALDVLNQMNL